jgi:hypothetical protein
MAKRNKAEDPVGTILRMPKELHDKIRWVAFRDHTSQNNVIVGVLEEAMALVKVPKEKK